MPTQTNFSASGGRGLVSVLEILDGRALVNRRATRERDQANWATVWQRLDSALHDAGLAGAPWVPAWIASLKRGGILTRAGSVAAGKALDNAVAGIALLLEPADNRRATTGAEPTWELAALASRVVAFARGGGRIDLLNTKKRFCILMRAHRSRCFDPNGFMAERNTRWHISP